MALAQSKNSKAISFGHILIIQGRPKFKPDQLKGFGRNA